MFGYVKADKPQMRICEYEAYRSVYCALCKRLGKNYGRIYSSTLNFDFTFVALIGIAVNEKNCGFEKKRCCLNPFVKCGFCTEDGGVLDYTSAAAIMMIYFKVLDNITDKSVFKRFIYYIIKPFVKKKYKKAKAAYPKMAQLFESEIVKSSNNEMNENCSPDAAAEPSAKILAGILSGFSTDENEKRILDRLGYCIGRWVYLIDAADDFNDDKKNENFNVFVRKYEKLDENNKDEIRNILNMNISEAAGCFNLIETKRFNDIIENILHLGMPGVQEDVLHNRFRKDEKLDRSI